MMLRYYHVPNEFAELAAASKIGLVGNDTAANTIRLNSTTVPLTELALSKETFVYTGGSLATAVGLDPEYRPVQLLRDGRRTVGFAFSGFKNPTAAEFVHSVAHCLPSKKLSLLIVSTPTRPLVRLPHPITPEQAWEERFAVWTKQSASRKAFGKSDDWWRSLLINPDPRWVMATLRTILGAPCDPYLDAIRLKWRGLRLAERFSHIAKIIDASQFGNLSDPDGANPGERVTRMSFMWPASHNACSDEPAKFGRELDQRKKAISLYRINPTQRATIRALSIDCGEPSAKTTEGQEKGMDARVSRNFVYSATISGCFSVGSKTFVTVGAQRGLRRGDVISKGLCPRAIVVARLWKERDHGHAINAELQKGFGLGLVL
jgi:hypothetical protein